MTSRIVRARGVLLGALVLLLTGIWFGRSSDSRPLTAQPAQAAAAIPVPGAAPIPDSHKRVVAYLYGTAPITREEFGEYFVKIYGEERLQYFVTKRIIEMACARKGIDVTPLEVDAAILEDCKRMAIEKKDFISTVLKQRYHKTLDEWRIDVIKPRLLLAKLCADRIDVTDAEIQHMYENRYGEKARVKIILWPKDQEDAARNSYAQLRKPGPKEKPDLYWDEVATKQPNAVLAASAGLIDPIGRHSGPATAKIEEIAFSLKVGDVSALYNLQQAGHLVVKRIDTVPAVQGVEFDKVKADLRKEVVDRRLDQEVPLVCEAMKKEANPVLRLGHAGRPPNGPAPDGNNAVAYVYGNVPITREEYGDYFINLYGEERLPLYVNKRIIECECARKGIVVTPKEVEAAITEDCKAMKIERKDFIDNVLKQRYHKTLEEWRVDVVRPRLMLARLCRDRIQVSDDELRQMYENRYGEKAKVKIILWPKDQREFALKSYGQLRQPGPEENPDVHWNSIATKQPGGALAATGGAVKPIGRHSGPETAKIEEIAFGLKVGDVSPIIELAFGCLVVKRVGTVAPQPNVDFEKVKADLRREVIDRKIDRDVPVLFEEMKKQANPMLLLARPALPEPDPSLLQR